ncbi:MAG: transcriptional repressor [Treponema sp.]|nr:MAG: transcriptional repressor [Treponema sp.]
MAVKYKYSRQREEIYKILKSTKIHPTAQWIYEQTKKELPNISLGTVYRNLNILIDQKRITVLHTCDDFDHYEANVMPHYHIICQKCKKIEDLDTDKLPSVDGNIISAAEDASGYKITNRSFSFLGICADCQAKSSGQTETD